MSALLDTIYSAVILLVAIAGIAFVFYETDGSGTDDEGPKWSRWGLTVVVAVFLAVMVGGLIT